MTTALAFRRALCAILISAGVAAAPVGAAPSASRIKLKQLVAELEKNPGDADLRGRIIDLAKTMRPAPAEPEEVDELKGMAREKFLTAKSVSDFGAAADAFAKVTLVAPWVGDYYLNLGLALEKADDAEAAIANLRLYLKANPGAGDAKKVRERIGKLKARVEADSQGFTTYKSPHGDFRCDIPAGWNTSFASTSDQQKRISYLSAIFSDPADPAQMLVVRWYRLYSPHRLYNGALEMYASSDDFAGQMRSWYHNAAGPLRRVAAKTGKSGLQFELQNSSAALEASELGFDPETQKKIIFARNPSGFSLDPEILKRIGPGRHAFAVFPTADNNFYVLVHPAPLGGKLKYTRYYNRLIDSFATIGDGPSGEPIATILRVTDPVLGGVYEYAAGVAFAPLRELPLPGQTMPDATPDDPAPTGPALRPAEADFAGTWRCSSLDASPKICFELKAFKGVRDGAGWKLFYLSGHEVTIYGALRIDGRTLSMEQPGYFGDQLSLTLSEDGEKLEGTFHRVWASGGAPCPKGPEPHACDLYENVTFIKDVD